MSGFTDNPEDSNRFKNQTKIVQIAGSPWILGMTWWSSQDKQSRKEIREEAAKLGANIAVQRITDATNQVGYGYVEGIKANRKLRSLAAGIASGVQQPWRGIYLIEEGLWWYIAVRQDFAILPGSDVVGNAEAISRAQAEHHGFGDWLNKNGVRQDLEMLVADVSTASPAPIFLEQSHKKFYAASLAGLALVGSGAYLWHEHQLKIAAEQKAKLLYMEKLEHRKLGAPAKPPSPLLSIPMPDPVVHECMKALNEVPYSIGGWTLANETCTPLGLSVIWERRSGATLAHSPAGSIGLKGDHIYNQIPVRLVGPKINNATKIGLAVTDFRIIMQSANVNASVYVIDPPKPRHIIGKPTPPAIPQPPKAEVSFVWPTNPVDVAWNQIPGFRIKSIAWDKIGWKINGVIYGKR